MSENVRKKLAVWKFASCDGCQLSILDLEDELLLLSETVEIAYFLEASSRCLEGPYDLSLVEGSVTTPDDIERIREVRRLSKYLLTIGACATAGGIQALRNFKDVREFASIVYAKPDYIKTLDKSIPIGQLVEVDFELRGCPIQKYQLLELISSYLLHKKPSIPNDSVCAACKRKGNVCVRVANGEACLGPVTHAGCGALCPSYGRGCYGCYGPKENANTTSLSQFLIQQGESPLRIFHLFRNFNAAAEDFAAESQRHEPKPR